MTNIRPRTLAKYLLAPVCPACGQDFSARRFPWRALHQHLITSDKCMKTTIASVWKKIYENSRARAVLRRERPLRYRFVCASCGATLAELEQRYRPPDLREAVRAAGWKLLLNGSRCPRCGREIDLTQKKIEVDFVWE